MHTLQYNEGGRREGIYLLRGWTYKYSWAALLMHTAESCAARAAASHADGRGKEGLGFGLVGFASYGKAVKRTKGQG